jgi:hypothetical protein
VLNRAGFGDLAVLREVSAGAPFRHLCIDNFLLPALAQQALDDFPVSIRRWPQRIWSRRGQGGQHADGRHQPLLSPPLRSSVQRGVPLHHVGHHRHRWADRRSHALWRGTHENLHGQDLDPHIDFNYVPGGGAHRRVNLLIYLNKDWDSDWGGDIELHSDPRHPQDNRISAYRVDFNRAVLFETNEHSWHGFPQIHLPEALRATHSRKCISIYLYTRERPVEEIAGEHGTFYVQRPCRRASVPAMCWMRPIWWC